jgi:hypothetical protein
MPETWHDSYVPVVMILVALAILAGVFVAATGRGGELAYEQADHAPLDLGPVSATEVAALRPPTALWGYNMQVTDEALERIAQALRDRDVTIAYLQQRLTGVTPGPPVPDHSVPDHSVPDHSVPDHSVSDHFVPEHLVPDPAVPDPAPPVARTGPDPVLHDPLADPLANPQADPPAGPGEPPGQ